MFENLKIKFLERIERNAIKSELKGEVVYLKKGSIFAPIPIFGPYMSDWGRIYPAVNEDGTWNITNLVFGGTRNLIKLILIGALVAVVLLAFKELFGYIEILRQQLPVQIQV